MSLTYIIASFKYSYALELAISDIEQLGINQTQIKAVPLVKESTSKNTNTKKYVNEEGFSLFDASFILGNLLGILFMCFGYIWKWGPIIWGLIGFFIGVFIGAIIKIIRDGWEKNKRDRKNHTEVFLMVKCPSELRDAVYEILWNHNVIGIAEI